MKLILDIETTRQKNPITGKDDPTPYNPQNKLVTVQFLKIDENEVAAGGILVFNHKENANDLKLAWDNLQEILLTADVIIGHNLKFDIQWLRYCGFKYDGPLYDTMIFEYVCAKGLKAPMGLKDIAIKYELPLKLDILQDYWEKGLNTDEIPLAELTEYAMQDIETTYALYKLQQSKLETDKDVQFMLPAIELTNEALNVILEMERNGCKIDLEALQTVEKEYIEELEQLERGIRLMVGEIMGDTPINLSSPDDMSKLLYGIEFIDKEAKKRWITGLNIGTDERNAVKKKRYPKRLRPKELKALKKACFQTVYKTEAVQCQTCRGHGKIFKVKKDGNLYKKENICTGCQGKRFNYIQDTTKKAGLRLRADDTFYATAAGFAADKKVITKYLAEGALDEDEKAFLAALQRHSAITSYLATFVEGIRNNVRESGYLHTNLNQCITATGRLSSSGPNFQNLPRGATFPVRRAITSRFDGGNILEIDFSQLEYRTAVMLAECEVGLQNIISGVDMHQFSGEIIFGVRKNELEPLVWKGIRQASKSHTFKPLYGGQTGTEAEQKYYKAFLETHTGIAKWHDRLCTEAVNKREIRTFTGRIFAFPKASRNQNGSVKGKTQIVNYPVQSVATADIIWIVLVDLLSEMQKHMVKSKLMLQVHDAVVLDVHPEETKDIIKMVKNSFDKVHDLMYTRYQYKTKVPIASEMAMGLNWNDKKEIAA